MIAKFEAENALEPGQAMKAWKEYLALAQIGKIQTPDEFTSFPLLPELAAKINEGDRLMPGILGILELLSSYRLSIISNFTAELDDILEHLGVKRFFLTVINSAFVGVRKPDPKIYRFACTQLNVAPNEAVFIDDRQENIDGAIQYGMNAILFTTPDDLRRQLQAHGILLDTNS